MSATINSAPSPAAAVAQLVLNSAGAADVATVAADAGTAAAGTGSFGALFQQLLGKAPAIADFNPNLLVLAADAMKGAAGGEDLMVKIKIKGDAGHALMLKIKAELPVEVDQEAVLDENLAALMPFLEGMGLIKNAPEETGENIGIQAISDGDADPATLAGVAPALTPQLLATPAISAAPTLSGSKERASSSLLASSGALVQADTRPTAEIRAKLPVVAAVMAEPVRADAQGAELSAEFSSILETLTDKAAGAPVVPNPSGLVSQASTAPSGNQATAMPVGLHLGSSGWSEEVGNRLVWMANHTNSHAELVLTPPQMGRVEVNLSISGDQATATFISANPAVREALEAAMPRLREVLADAGIQLGQAQVGAENARQSAQQEKNGDNFRFSSDTTATAGTSPMAALPQPAASGLKIGRGLVDVFA